jgi:hypothetical protein
MIYSKSFMDKFNLNYLKKIKKKLAENIVSQRIFFLILDAWTSINQKSFLGIII